MEHQEYLEKIDNFAHHIVKKYPSVKKSTQNRVTLDGITLRYGKFFSDYLLSDINDYGLLDKGLEAVKDNSAMLDFVSSVVQRINYIKRQNLTQELIQENDGELDLSIDPGAFDLFIDLENNVRFFYDMQRREVSSINVDAWLSLLNKDESEVLKSSMKPAKTSYEPYDITPIKTISESGGNFALINLYSPPAWRLTPEKPAKCPPIIDRVLDHLFPFTEEREYVENWLFQALTGRNEVYLVLNGAKGIGKGVFTSLLRSLVGRQNYSEAPVALLISNFNAILDQKRVVVMDEFRVGKKEHTRLKRFANRYQNIEKKGFDATEAVETYNSYLIANNDLSDMFLEYDDRRFSVPQLTSKALTEIMGQEEIAELTQELDNEESDLIKEFGYYIFFNGENSKFNEFSVLKTKRFYDLVYASLTEWQKFIVDKVLSREAESYRVKGMAKEFSKEHPTGRTFPRNYQKIQDFLDNYRHEGVERIGELDREGRDVYLIPAEQYRSEVVEESDQTENDIDFL